MGPFPQYVRLRFLGGHVLAFHEPTEGQSCTPPPPCFAVQINNIARSRVGADEADPPMYIVERWCCEINNREMKLNNVMQFVFLDWPPPFSTHVDDTANPKLLQLWNKVLERQSTKHDVFINLIPPMTGRNKAMQEKIP